MEEKNLRPLTDKEVLKNIVVGPEGIAAALLGLLLGLVFFIFYSTPAYVETQFLGIEISSITQKVLCGTLGAIFPPLLFLGGDFFLKRKKLVRCLDCGKIRHADWVTIEKKKVRCPNCYHEV